MVEILNNTPPAPSGNEPAKPAPAAANPANATPPPVAAGGEGAGDGAHSPPAPAPTAPAEPKPAAQAKKKDWRDDRIATLTAKLKESQEAKQTPLAVPDPAVPAKPLDANAEFNRLVAEKAAELSNAKSFAEKCNVETERGKAKWADFDDRLADLKSVVNESDPQEVKAYYDLLNAGLETGELHTLVYELGQDLDEATRMLKLSPVKMAIELTKKAVAAPRVDEVSKLPKPVTPVTGGRGEQVPVDPSNPLLADGLDTKEWMQRREEQLKARSAR